MPVRKRKHKGLRVSNLAFLLVVFKWHHGSEGVKPGVKIRNKCLDVLVTGLLFLQPSRVVSGRDQLNVRNISAHESIYSRVQSNAEYETGKRNLITASSTATARTIRHFFVRTPCVRTSDIRELPCQCGTKKKERERRRKKLKINKTTCENAFCR